MSKKRVVARPDYSHGPGYRSFWYRLAVGILRPLIRAITKREFQGWEHIPKTGGVIVTCNHFSYFDPLAFALFLHDSGRSPRFVGKAEVFRVPLIGHVLLGAGQIPVERETPDAKNALDAAIEAVNKGEMLALYPEGTLTRDPNIWPMVAKNGVARIALATGAPVIPVAQWGAQEVIPVYGKKIKLFPRTRIQVKAGPPVDLSQWKGRDDHEAHVEVAAAIMKALTEILVELRGEPAPSEPFDPKKNPVPRIGNFKKKRP